MQKKSQLLLIAVGFLAVGLYFVLNSNWPLFIFLGIGSWPLLWQIINKIIKKDLGADILAAISIVAAVILGEYLAGVLVLLMLATGQALETFALNRASSVLQELAKRMPNRARRRRDGFVEEIEIFHIDIGDVIEVAPHETCPMDGVVLSGHSFMNESYLTGEPYGVAKAPGAQVISGAINGEGLLVIKAEKKSEHSRYASIMRVMAEAEQKKPKIRRLADNLGAVFAPLSLVIAVVVWVITGDPLRFLAVLVVATPCPLFIAIPVAVISAISLAARLGIIINDPVVLERLPTCQTAIFDKTGTLTYGKPELIEVHVLSELSRKDVMCLAASLEQYSKHPLSQAVLDAARREKLTLADAEQVRELPGQGLFGIVKNAEVLITGRKNLSPSERDALPKSDIGLECILVVNKKIVAMMRFRDEPRHESESFVHHLGPLHNFKEVILVSGDREAEVGHLARRLGISDRRASQSPADKLAIVEAYTKKGPTLFMGDGVNDAPALKAATVGIAFGQPSEATQMAAGAVVLQNSLSKVDELLHLSKTFRMVALTSAIGGMALSVVAMGFAAWGYISPAMGAVLQQVIDALAILNALWITFKRRVKIDLPQ